jgi:hypothetical protein
MATQVQFRRGTTAQNSSFTGAAGELTINTDIDSIIVHDGSTQGGVGVAKDDLSNTASVGVLTATSFVGPVTGNATGLSGSPSITVTDITAVGNVSIAGTLTYEDVTSVDALGIGTFRTGVRVTTGGIAVAAGGLSVTGVITASNGVTGNLTGDVTGNADTATTLATSRTLSISGAGTGSASFNGSGDADIALTLANSGVSASTYGSSSAIPILTVDAKGLVTSASTTAIDSTTVSNGTASVAVASNGPITSTGNHDFTAGIDVTGNITVTGTVDGRDVATDGSKLDGIESGATADQTAAEIRTLVESATDSNVFTDADHSKLNGIEASADVTDATNVNAAGAVMNSDTTTGSMSFVIDEDNMSSNSATKVPTQQSVKAYVDSEVSSLVDSAPGALDTLNELAAALGDDASFSTTVTNSIATKLPLAGGTMTGNIVMSGSQTVDGRDLSADGSKLDGIESGATADQSAAEIRSLVESASDSNVFTDADHSKLNGIASGATNVTNNNQLTNGSGFITSVAFNSLTSKTSGTGNYTTTGNFTAANFNSTSDINLKENIEVVTSATEMLNQIRGVKFTWKETEELSVGVIAQDVEKVLPELISERDDETKTVNYNGLIGVLIEAVKEQQKQIDDLKGEVNKLKGNA